MNWNIEWLISLIPLRESCRKVKLIRSANAFGLRVTMLFAFKTKEFKLVNPVNASWWMLTILLFAIDNIESRWQLTNPRLGTFVIWLLSRFIVKRFAQLIMGLANCCICELTRWTRFKLTNWLMNKLGKMLITEFDCVNILTSLSVIPGRWIPVGPFKFPSFWMFWLVRRQTYVFWRASSKLQNAWFWAYARWITEIITKITKCLNILSLQVRDLNCSYLNSCLNFLFYILISFLRYQWDQQDKNVDI